MDRLGGVFKIFQRRKKRTVFADLLQGSPGEGAHLTVPSQLEQAWALDSHTKRCKLYMG